MTSTADSPAATASVSAQARDTAIAVRLVFLRAAYDKLLAQRDSRKHKALYDAIKAVAGTTFAPASNSNTPRRNTLAAWVVAWGAARAVHRSRQGRSRRLPVQCQAHVVKHYEAHSTDSAQS